MTSTASAPPRSAPGALFSFPNPVDERAARTVAGGVVVLALVTIVSGVHWLTLLIAYGFVARVLTGPKLSPLGLLATRVLVPRYTGEPKLVAGPPKRFAQAIGVLFSVTAAVLAVGFDQWLAAQVVLGLLVVAATLESVFGICLGCAAFAFLMRRGVVPEEVCARCNDIWSGREHEAPTASRAAA
ncbi:MAG TPA: DUF4395 domain-containing protein [Mycobacteriales bacterium]|nr:DUF4395 domain-containing protein [Mycobacteriales bacterium]